MKRLCKHDSNVREDCRLVAVHHTRDCIVSQHNTSHPLLVGIFDHFFLEERVVLESQVPRKGVDASGRRPIRDERNDESDTIRASDVNNIVESDQHMLNWLAGAVHGRVFGGHPVSKNSDGREARVSCNPKYIVDILTSCDWRSAWLRAGQRRIARGGLNDLPQVETDGWGQDDRRKSDYGRAWQVFDLTYV